MLKSVSHLMFLRAKVSSKLQEPRLTTLPILELVKLQTETVLCNVGNGFMIRLELVWVRLEGQFNRGLI